MKEDNKSKPVIEVIDVDKSFKIGNDRAHSLKSVFVDNVKNFFKSRKGFDALSDVSFTVEKGEFVGIVGKNGSGKSTLLKIIAGILSPNKGKIVLNGRLIPFLELGVGFNDDLTARENVFLNGAILGMTKKFLDDNYDQIVEFAELEEFMETPIKNFSSGMKVRLAFSIAVLAEADIYLLDEILSVGDIGFREKSLNKMLDLIKNGATVIFVSHDLGVMQKLCDRLIYMKKGRLIADGDPEGVVEQYEISFMTESQRESYLDKKKKLIQEGLKSNEIINIISKSMDEGDGRALIEEIRIMDSEKELKNKFKSNDKIKILVKFKAVETIENANLVVVIGRNFSDFLYTFSTTIKGDNKLGRINKGQEFEVTFDGDIKLSRGEYHVKAQVEERISDGSKKIASLSKRTNQLEVSEEILESGLVRHEYDCEIKVK